MDTVSLDNHTRRFAFGRLWRVAVAAAVLAMAGNAIVYLLANNIFGIPVATAMVGDMEYLLPIGMVVFASAAPAFVAAMLLAVLDRLTGRPVLLFQIVSAAVLLASFAGPFGLTVSLATKLVLGLMHVVAAALIVGLFTSAGRGHGPEAVSPVRDGAAVSMR